MSSIRGKIVAGYAVLAAGVAAFALLAWGDLNFVEARVEEGIAVGAFREQVLEMRRHEKNHFLYGGGDELDEALHIATTMEATLARERKAFAAVIPVAEIDALHDALGRYRELLDRYRERRGTAAATRIRATGHEISEGAEKIANLERKLLAATVQDSRRLLLFGVGMVALLGILGGQVLSRMAVRPLRKLEEQLKPIAAGDFAHFPEVSRDREIASLTAALNRMLDELESHRLQVLHSEKLASLGVLASGVAHELNNPLGNISSSCQILLEELDTTDIDKLREWLGQIDGETQRAQRIVRTLLDYARRRGFAPVATRIAEVADKSLVLLRSSLPEVDLTLDLAPDLAVLADPQRLQQAFINLVKNAADAGAKHIVVSARRATADNWPPAEAYVIGAAPADRPGVVIAVSDDGSGIRHEDLTMVFDPFFTTRAPGQGVGLGLYIVEEIAQEHGGCVAAASLAAGGARFALWLPGAEAVA